MSTIFQLLVAFSSLPALNFDFLAPKELESSTNGKNKSTIHSLKPSQNTMNIIIDQNINTNIKPRKKSKRCHEISKFCVSHTETNKQTI